MRECGVYSAVPVSVYVIKALDVIYVGMRIYERVSVFMRQHFESVGDEQH